MQCSYRTVPIHRLVVVVIAIMLLVGGDGLGSVRAQPTDEEPLLRELIHRLLRSQLAVRPSPVDSVHLLLSSWPADAPLALPIPPGAHLVGSAVRGHQGRLAGIEAVLEAPGTAAELLAYYRRELGDRGWHSPPRGLPIPGGPPPIPIPNWETATFCDSRSRQVFALQIAANPGGFGEMRVGITNPTRFTECDHPPSAPTVQSPSPTDRYIAGFSGAWLSIPMGVQVYPISGGGSAHYSVSRFEVQGEQTTAALAVQFGTQLEAAGWIPLAAWAEGPVAWSAWQIGQVATAEHGAGTWHGLLSLVESPTPNHHALTLETRYVRMAGDDPRLPVSLTDRPLGGESAETGPLRALGERLLRLPLRLGAGSSDGPFTLLPQQLPDDVPLDLPIPAESHLIGSITRSQQERPASSLVVLDVAGSPADLLAAYREMLNHHGWRVVPHPPPGRIGFLDALDTESSSSFCAGRDSVELVVSAVPRAADLSEVRLYIDHVVGRPCPANWSLWPEQPNNTPGGRPGGLLPRLYAPVGAERRDAGHEAAWLTILQTGWSATALEAHYAQQLAAAGWSRQASQPGAPLAWSTWRAPEGVDARGVLAALEWPGTDLRTLLLLLAPPYPAVGWPFSETRSPTTPAVPPGGPGRP
jgi:hypothetical protein